MKSNINRDKNETFIAQSKFIPAQGVTVRLGNGAVLKHLSSQIGENSVRTNKEFDS